MDTSSKVKPRSYEDFKPLSEWKREEKADTLVISLPGMSSILDIFSTFDDD